MNWQERYSSPEAEQAVLGSILREPELIHETTLIPADFTSSAHQLIFETMTTLKNKKSMIDPIMIVSTIGTERAAQIGGASYLLGVHGSVLTTQGFSDHERIVRDHSNLRRAMTLLSNLSEEPLEEPEVFSARLMEIAESVNEQNQDVEGFQHIRDGMIEHFEGLEQRLIAGVAPGCPTPGESLDDVIGRYQKQTLNIVAARPSMGKTAFMLNGVRRAAAEGYTALVFSLEQPRLQLYDRMIAAEGTLRGQAIKKAELTEAEWTTYTMALSRLGDLPIYVDDRAGLTIQLIRAAVRRAKKKYPNLIVYIDYLQLIQSSVKKNQRHEEVGYISSQLKEMARENDCPVIALAQLSRGVEQRQDKRPMMSDLRESGNIEQDADTITFLYRDDYYNALTENRNIIECSVAKNREGSVGVAEMVFLKEYGKFVDRDYGHSWPGVWAG